jgi:hypothetical protein
MSCHHDPPASFEPSNLDGVLDRVGIPAVTNPFACVDAQLLLAINSFGRRRDDLADPIRREGVTYQCRNVRQMFRSPASEVRHEYVWTEMEFRLEEDPPPTGAIETFVEWAEMHPEPSFREAMRRRWPWRYVKLAVEDFRDLVIGNFQEIVVRGRTLRRFRLVHSFEHNMRKQRSTSSPRLARSRGDESVNREKPIPIGLRLRHGLLARTSNA